jgi:predicted CoA-binding protein
LADAYTEQASANSGRQAREGAPDGSVEDRLMDAPLRERLLRIYAETKTIAVVGASGDPSKPAHTIPSYLQRQGYRIVPVNPHGGELFGQPVARSLAEVDGLVDLVEVFRPANEAPEIAREAVEVGAKVLWLQLGSPPRRPGRWPRRLG